MKIYFFNSRHSALFIPTGAKFQTKNMIKDIYQETGWGIRAWFRCKIQVLFYQKNKKRTQKEPIKKQKYICEVTFFREQRQHLPHLKGGYRPHFVVKGTTEYLGIQFFDGEVLDFEQPTLAAAFSLYSGVDYSPLIVGAEFWIMEGGNCVGEGILLEINLKND